MEEITLSPHQLELLHQLVHGCDADQVLDLVIAMLTIAHEKRLRQHAAQQRAVNREHPTNIRELRESPATSWWAQ